MPIIKKERVYYHGNVYKITFFTVLRQCLGHPHRYCFLSPLHDTSFERMGELGGNKW